ncbi:bifunctional UDP-N-acetylglucosamine diphosphorylase/glucosamine-1-phosphate N-acetyltransferase GlmU [Virgibacillus halophilus]|uniref:Bifunctional protein GlmU n=1 Tax=Tigheibacillus halophilus TaxID=361280 RepID=A0ABU5C6A4_9BACI|nr:bifunctional UDP-N-acetylglucosamine diphosphorylase/glucosamine-1-phosphate N-acetyltransferase GlmU [Virgibacillus halophilus]
MKKHYAIVLAAGQGTRMKSKLYKVLHPVMGVPMVKHVLHAIKGAGMDEIVTIVGHGAEEVQAYIGEESEFAVQEEQLGTGHAAVQAGSLLKGKAGTTLVVCGDTPLIEQETFQKLIAHHEKSGAKATILTTEMPDPAGYGRVVRDAKNEVERIVEHKDASEKEHRIKEINTGTYCFDNEALFTALENLSNDNAQGEYYLTDVIGILKQAGKKVEAYVTPDADETLGVNDRIALAEAEQTMKKRTNIKHMKNGVTIIDPDNTYIDPRACIESDVTVYPGSIIRGDSVIKSEAVIGPNTEISNCHVGSGTVVKHSVAADSLIGENVQIGPFAHIRPESEIGNHVKIGNFMEIKKAKLGENSKFSHLSYIGDAHVGSNVNIGCGTITVNYDGKNKYLTTIEDDAFIGCNSNLVAPVTVGKGSYVAAGSTITKDVPAEALSIARSRQSNKEGYATRLKNRKKD